MSTNPENGVMGPADVYWAEFGAAEPLDTQWNGTPAASAWTDLGGTVDGLDLGPNRTFTELKFDQITQVAGSRLTEDGFIVTINAGELTLENLKLALNGGTIATGGAGPTLFRTFDPDYSISATQPAYKALIIDGWGPGGKRRRAIVRKVLNVGSPKHVYAKDKQAMFALQLKAHYVSASISPYRWVDDDTA